MPKKSPGKKRPPGRPKGVPNRITSEIRKAIQDRDPVGELFKIVERSEDDKLKVQALLGVMRYGYPALSATQVDLSLPQKPVVHKVYLKKGEGDGGA